MQSPQQMEHVLTLVVPYASPRSLLALAGVSKWVRQVSVEELERRSADYKCGALVKR